MAVKLIWNDSTAFIVLAAATVWAVALEPSASVFHTIYPILSEYYSHDHPHLLHLYLPLVVTLMQL